MKFKSCGTAADARSCSSYLTTTNANNASASFVAEKSSGSLKLNVKYGYNKFTPNIFVSAGSIACITFQLDGGRIALDKSGLAAFSHYDISGAYPGPYSISKINSTTNYAFMLRGVFFQIDKSKCTLNLPNNNYTIYI